MPWWGWIAMGAMLLVAELAIVDAEFFLVFLGVSAAVVGVLRLVGLPGVWWLDWLIFAGLSVVTMVTFRRRVYERLRRASPPPDDSVIGQSIVLERSLATGETCRAEFRGTMWTVSNVGDAPIVQGHRAWIQETEGLTLKVRGE